MERIGIFGGTFNPPHLGHIQAAQCALDVLRLDKLLLIPDRIAPHKQLPDNSATSQQRLEMLRIAVRHPKMEVSDIEMQREGPSYTYKTINQLRVRYPEAKLYLLMGTDMFLSFPEWREFRQIQKQVTLAVMYRGDQEEKEKIQKQKAALEAQGAEVVLVENPVNAISSTQLRRLLAFHCAGDFLPEGVGDYIQTHELYDVAADWKCLPMDDLEKVVIRLLNPNRVAHVLGCRDTAMALSERWGANVADAARAGMLHDVTKALDGPLQLTLCAAYGTIISDFSAKNPKTLHALTGSLVAERIFGENAAVVSAIRHHTTGKADMTLLEKIIYVADYMEPNRDFPGVERLRHLAFTNIDGALKLGLEMTVAMLTQQGRTVSRESIEALEWLVSHGV